MRVDWLGPAQDQVDEIAGGRARWSEAAGRRLRTALIRRADQVALFPYSGRMLPEFQMEHLREVIEQGFRIFYEVFEDHIEVFGVVSARADVFGEHE